MIPTHFNEKSERCAVCIKVGHYSQEKTSLLSTKKREVSACRKTSLRENFRQADDIFWVKPRTTFIPKNDSWDFFGSLWGL